MHTKVFSDYNVGITKRLYALAKSEQLDIKQATISDFFEFSEHYKYGVNEENVTIKDQDIEMQLGFIQSILRRLDNGEPDTMIALIQQSICEYEEKYHTKAKKKVC